MGLKKEVVEKLITLMTAAFGLIAALAWNDAVKSLFSEGGFFYFAVEYGVWVYAVFVTIIAVLITIWVSKVSARMK